MSEIEREAFAIIKDAIADFQEIGDFDSEYNRIPAQYQERLDALIARAQAAQPASGVPEGYVAMPQALTAENGAKAALMGEFDVTLTLACPECDERDMDPECEICQGATEYDQPVPVGWSTIKAIYQRAVEVCGSSPHPQNGGPSDE